MWIAAFVISNMVWAVTYSIMERYYSKKVSGLVDGFEADVGQLKSAVDLMVLERERVQQTEDRDKQWKEFIMNFKSKTEA